MRKYNIEKNLKFNRNYITLTENNKSIGKVQEKCITIS
jgi:hypothetical protein